MIHADTEGLLDKCHCGAVAGFERGKDPDTGEFSERARCTDCCEQTRWSATRGEAMADWNWNMRRLSNTQGQPRREKE